MALHPLEPGTEFIRNPGGAVVDVAADQLAVTLAKEGVTGWKFATADEIKKYCESNNLQAPDLKNRAADVKKLQSAGAKLEADEVESADEAAAAVDVAHRDE